MNIKIDISSHKKYVDILQGMHRKNFPLAVRSTINDAAFETKKKIPETASEKFHTRSKTLFRAHTGVNRATGFDLNTMESAVGIGGNKAKKNSQLAKGLATQEKGGVIKSRKLIPHNRSRISNNLRKKVRKVNHFDRIKIGRTNPGNGQKGKGRTTRYLLIEKGNKGTVFKVIPRAGKRKDKLVPLYHFRNNTNSRVKRSSYIKDASLQVQKEIPSFFEKNAKFRILKELKKL